MQIPECMRPSHLNERVLLLHRFMEGCRQLDACPNCALAAAFYAAAQAAIKGLQLSEEGFLDMAKEVFRDVQKQLASELMV